MSETADPKGDGEKAKASKLKSERDPFILDKQFGNVQELSLRRPPALQVVQDALFVLDANVLLAPYRVGKESLDDIKVVLRKLADANRVFIPFRALQEFSRHRAAYMRDLYENIQKRHGTGTAPSDFDLRAFRGFNGYEQAAKSVGEIKEAFNSYRKSLRALQQEIRNWNWNDELAAFYWDELGAKAIFPRKSQQELVADLAFRASHEVPPGYKDAKKSDGGIGDLIIWWCILELGRDLKKNVVFVTNEFSKGDWTVSLKKEALFPRFELVYEFHQYTCGQHFWLMNFTAFLENQQVSRETINAIRQADLDSAVAPKSRNSRGNLIPFIHRGLMFLHDSHVSLALTLEGWGSVGALPVSEQIRGWADEFDELSVDLAAGLRRMLPDQLPTDYVDAVLSVMSSDLHQVAKPRNAVSHDLVEDEEEDIANAAYRFSENYKKFVEFCANNGVQLIPGVD